MNTNEILSKLEKAAPGKVLESGRFGRAELLSVWVEASAVQPIAHAISQDSALKIQWLENLSVAEVGDSLVISWFARSRETQAALVIRSSVELKSRGEAVELPSVREIWSTASPLEDEVAELFGIRFKKLTGEALEFPRTLLPGEPSNESGFPMRKSFNIGGSAK